MKKRRTTSLMVRLSIEEKEYITEKAKENGLAPSTFLRFLGVKGKKNDKERSNN